jgi:hypothetical protein
VRFADIKIAPRDRKGCDAVATVLLHCEHTTSYKATSDILTITGRAYTHFYKGKPPTLEQIELAEGVIKVALPRNKAIELMARTTNVLRFLNGMEIIDLTEYDGRVTEAGVAAEV